MGLTNGDTVAAADLNTVLDHKTALQTANRYSSNEFHPLTFTFNDVVTGTAEDRRSVSFTIPDDDKELVGMHVDIANPSGGTVTVTMTGGTGLMLGGDLTYSTTSLDVNSEVTPTVRMILLRGAEYTITVSNTSSGSSRITAQLLLKSKRRKR